MSLDLGTRPMTPLMIDYSKDNLAAAAIEEQMRETWRSLTGVRPYSGQIGRFEIHDGKITGYVGYVFDFTQYTSGFEMSWERDTPFSARLFKENLNRALDTLDAGYNAHLAEVQEWAEKHPDYEPGLNTYLGACSGPFRITIPKDRYGIFIEKETEDSMDIVVAKRKRK